MMNESIKFGHGDLPDSYASLAGVTTYSMAAMAMSPSVFNELGEGLRAVADTETTPTAFAAPASGGLSLFAAGPAASGVKIYSGKDGDMFARSFALPNDITPQDVWKHHTLPGSVRLVFAQRSMAKAIRLPMFRNPHPILAVSLILLLIASALAFDNPHSIVERVAPACLLIFLCNSTNPGILERIAHPTQPLSSSLASSTGSLNGGASLPPL
jgi:hypothetical protein